MEDGRADGMTLRDYLAVPHIMSVQSYVGPDGSWRRRAFFPELEGCEVDGETAVEVIEAADRERVHWIVKRVARGAHVPVPRAPLAWVDASDVLAASGLEDWIPTVDGGARSPTSGSAGRAS